MFDSVWLTVVSLWNLRYMVLGIKGEMPEVTEKQLADKFSLGSGVHGVNFKKSFVEKTWQQQQSTFSWMLPNNTVAIYEGWIKDLKNSNFSKLNEKNLQFVGKVHTELSALIPVKSSLMSMTFYPTYIAKNKKWH